MIKFSWKNTNKPPMVTIPRNPAEFHDSSDHHTFKKMLPRDEKIQSCRPMVTWTATWEEFTAFLHPEEFEHMKEIVALKPWRTSTRTGDGFVDQDEYIVGYVFHEENALSQTGFYQNGRKRLNSVSGTRTEVRQR